MNKNNKIPEILLVLCVLTSALDASNPAIEKPENKPVEITWDAADYSSDTSSGSSTAVEKPFVMEYDADIDPDAEVWCMRVKKITGDITITVKTGGSRNADIQPPVSEAEAKAAVTIMDGYYARGARGSWHTEASSRAHEEHHYTEWMCSSDHYWPQAETKIEELSVSCKQYNTKESAIKAMRPSADALVKKFNKVARDYWFTLPDDASSRPYAAGQNVLNTTIVTVQALASSKDWTVPQGTTSRSAENPCFMPWLPFTP